MSLKRVFLSILIIVSICLSGALIIAQASPMSQPEEAQADSLPGYANFARINVQNNDTAALPSGYTVSFTVNTAALVGAGQMQADCDDLRISFTEASEVELDRLVTGCNTTGTVVTFRSQAAIGAGLSDTRYTLNYNNPAAATPPQNPVNIYAFYDDFQDGNADGWTVAKGTWGVANETGNYFYRYTLDYSAFYWLMSYASFPFSDLDYQVKIRAPGVAANRWIGAAFRIQTPAESFLLVEQNNTYGIFEYRRITANNIPDPDPFAGFTMPNDEWYWLRVQAVGSTVRARIWRAADAEPGSWMITTTETNYQTNTGIGLSGYNDQTSADWDEVTVRRMVAAEPTVTLSAWWGSGWEYRRPITVTNTSASVSLPTRYTASFTLNTAALISSGRMLSNCNDLRVVYDPTGMAPVQLDRVVEKCNDASTTVWFALQRPVAPSGVETAYSLYYGNASAGAPLANGMNVFLFFEDWEQGSAHWINAGGLDTGNGGLGTGTMGVGTSVTTAQAFSPTHSQLFNQRRSGGDAFSGYIPVSASTSYTFRSWGNSTSATTCIPVGIDPYTSAYGKGSETWFWLDNWPTIGSWSARSYSFVSGSTTAYIKIKSELWDNPSCPGAGPIYLDNLALYYTAPSAPTVALSPEEPRVPVLSISNIVEVSDPVVVGSSIQISADVTANTGSVSSVTLRILSPQAVDVPMTNISGNTWRASFTPNQGGTYTYQIYATGSTGATLSSAQYTFTATDTVLPVVSLVSITDPIFVNNTQILTVQATDNGLLSSVTVTVDAVVHPMTALGGNQYRYSWQVTTTGTIPYTVTATDTSGNIGTLSGSFVSQPRLADVCTWKGCRPGAASWSVDDGNQGCFTELGNAGIKGTYYYNGSSTLGWFATYAAAGHEIGSHTVGHPCNTPSCSPSCTYDSLMALPVDPAVVTAYRTGQVEPNIAAIEAGTGRPVLSLAWPCGCTDPSRMQAAASSVLGARGYYDYVAQLTWVEDLNTVTPRNFMLLNTAASYRQDFVDQAIAQGKWSITTSHGSCTGIDYLGQQNTAGTLWVAPVGDVLKYINVRNASQISNYSRAGQTITFDAVHNLPNFQPTNLTLLPIVYDNVVTLKALLEDGDVVQSVTVGGNPVAYSLVTINSVQYVTFDATLNASRHVVITLAPFPPTITNVSATPNPRELGGVVTFSATVVAAPGTSLGTVTLNVLSPEVQNLTMTLYSGDEYRVSFTPAQLGSYSYRVTATNNFGTPRQTTSAAFTVQDTTPPAYQTQSQSLPSIANGSSNTLSAEGSDLGNVVRAVLSTNENGDWQDFDWPASDWWNYSWTHRRPVTITEAAGLARTNELVDLSISSVDFTGLNSCVNELRVINQSGVEIPSQVYGEQVGGGVRTCHLVFQASPGAGGSQTFNIYYGNPSATAPSYTSDLTGGVNGSLRTVLSSYFNLDMDATSGIISRMRLPLGSNTNLPLSPTSDSYWGWHQVCSSAHGNITGKNAQCVGGTAPATGLTPADTISGPLLREYSFTSVKTGATFTVTFRFYAGTPYYRYTITRSGATASAVMSNFWYTNGYYPRLGIGSGGTPVLPYNTYDYDTDHFRMVSLATVALASVDGTNNDGTDLGGTDYMSPTATALDLIVAAGSGSAAIDGVLARFNAPLGSVVGSEENRPLGLYGSPIEMTPTSGWVSTSFLWQNPAITDTVVEWRIKYCDASGNCRYTPGMFFGVGNPTAVSLSSFNGKANKHAIQLDWETASEVELLGFNLYRSNTLDGPRQKQNAHLIQARKPGQLVGAPYQFSDLVSAGRRYYYWLEWVGVDGAEVAGPVIVNSDFLIHLPVIVH